MGHPLKLILLEINSRICLISLQRADLNCPDGESSIGCACIQFFVKDSDEVSENYGQPCRARDNCIKKAILCSGGEVIVRKYVSRRFTGEGWTLNDEDMEAVEEIVP